MVPTCDAHIQYLAVLKIMVQQSIQQQAVTAMGPLQDIQGNTIRIARLKLLYIAAKTPFHDNRKTVEYSEQDMRTPFLIRLLEFLDEARKQAKSCQRKIDGFAVVPDKNRF